LFQDHLYTHVPGKGELIDLMVDTVLGEAVLGEVYDRQQ
jgi:hypothetical protein